MCMLTAIREASAVSKLLVSPPVTRARAAASDDSCFAAAHLSLDTLFFLATLGGAQVCCLEDRMGNFVVGKEFDALLCQTGQSSDVEVESGTLVPEYQDGLNPAIFVQDYDELEVIFEKCKLLTCRLATRLSFAVIFTGDDRNIGTTFVRGRVVGGARPLS
jgi:guanine deaminase